MMTPRQKIQRARTALVLDQPFFGVLALRLAIIEDPACGTAATDGKSMLYDPAFIDALSHEEILAVVAHEVMHCAGGHPWRRDARDPFRWNVAADYAINCVLEEAGFKLPSFRLRDAKFDGQSAEWIYNRLPPQKQPKGGKSGKGGSGNDRPMGGGQDVRDAPSSKGQAAADAATESDWQQATQQAAAAAKARGHLPACLDRFAKAAAQPRVDWRSVLRRFVQQAAKADYSWTRPNARFLASGLYLPALRSEALGPIAVAVDTSGSIDNVTLGEFFAEINAIAGEMRPERVVVMYCDAKVGRTDTFERDDVIVPHPVGGGGTSHVPVMNAVDAMEETPVCLICLTDLYTEHRPEPPAVPVLWAATHPQEVPYGEVVSIANV
jgi:predicted metal-dependent peptidase